MSKNKYRYNRGEDYNYTCELLQDARYDNEVCYSICRHAPCPYLLGQIKSLCSNPYIMTDYETPFDLAQEVLKIINSDSFNG